LKEEATLTLQNMCRGGAEQIFQRDLEKVMENIADVSTPVDTKRKITLTIEFDPDPDRAGAVISFSSATKLSGVAGVRGKVFFARMGDEVKAFPENPNQLAMYGEPQTDSKQ
jgi:hypothetical protein